MGMVRGHPGRASGRADANADGQFGFVIVCLVVTRSVRANDDHTVAPPGILN